MMSPSVSEAMKASGGVGDEFGDALLALEPQGFEVDDDLPRQCAERARFPIGELVARGRVDEAERADPFAPLQHQRSGGVEPDMGRAHHQRMLDEARIPVRVEHDHRRVAEDGIAAEGDIARSLIDI